MRRALFVLMCALCVPVAAHAEYPPTVLDRLAVGVSVQAGIDSANTTKVLPQAWASYTLASQLSVAASAEWDATETDEFRYLYRIGPRVSLFGFGHAERGPQVGVGVDYVHYHKWIGWPVQKHNSYSVSLRASYGLLKGKDERMDAYLVGSAELDPDNDLTTYRLGVRVPLKD